MIGVDTNILIRYFTQDNLEQAQIAEQIITTYATSPNSLFVNNIVLCELIWVLERGYKYNKDTISSVIKQMLSTEEFVFEHQKLLWLALNQYNQTKLNFSDALIGELNKESGCFITLTFDQEATKVDNFKLAK